MIRLTLMAAAIGLLTACASRQIISVEDSPAGGNTTIIQTIDTKSYLFWGFAKTVWWECGPQGDGLTCEKRCDVRDDTGDRLACNKTQIFFQ